MPAGATYTTLATTTLSSTATDVTFSSISGSYTDLVLVINATIGTGNEDLQIQFNSDTATNYSWTSVDGSGTLAQSSRASNTSTPRLGGSRGAINTTNATWITNIQNYSNTTTFKTYVSRGSNSNFGVAATVGLWRSTSAITSIKLFPSGSTFSSGSTFTLYGIAAA